MFRGQLSFRSAAADPTPPSPPESADTKPAVQTLDELREEDVEKESVESVERPLMQMQGPFGTLLVTPLIVACAEADEDAVHRELERTRSQKTLHSALRDTDDWAGSTPLHWAAYAGSAPIVRALLDVQADPTARNTRDSALPLHLAARYNKTSEVIELLADAAPPTVNAVSARGNTPLHETCYQGRVAVAELLVERDANLEVFNHSDVRQGSSATRWGLLNVENRMRSVQMSLGSAAGGRRATSSDLLSAIV